MRKRTGSSTADGKVQKEKGSLAGSPAAIMTFIVREANCAKAKQHTRGREMSELRSSLMKKKSQRNIYIVCREPQRLATELISPYYSFHIPVNRGQ